MRKLNQKILKSIANIGLKAAVTASDTASWLGCYQPKEPENISKFK